MRPWLPIVLCALLSQPASAACTGPPYDQLDFWLGAWHDRATPAGEQYAVRRTAAGCAIEEVLTDGNGHVKGVGLAGWDSGRKLWRQLWADANRIVTAWFRIRPFWFTQGVLKRPAFEGRISVGSVSRAFKIVGC